MGLEKVIEDILRKGEEQRSEIIRQGERERDEQVSLAGKQMDENRRKAELRSKAQVAQMEQQELSSAELESKKAMLSAQRQIMEDLRTHTLSDLASYPDAKRKALYSKLASKARKELGDCYVYSNERDKPFAQFPSGVTYAGTIDCVGGLVFESKDRTVRLDYRFESILEEVWNKRMQEIYSRLFG